MNEKISGLLDPKMWEMSEDYKEKCRQQLQNYEERLKESPDALMRMLSRSMRFDRKTLCKLFHAVTHHKQVWFDVVIEFQDGSVDEGGFVAKTPHQLRFLLNKIHHIRTRYKISDRED